MFKFTSVLFAFAAIWAFSYSPTAALPNDLPSAYGWSEYFESLSKFEDGLVRSAELDILEALREYPGSSFVPDGVMLLAEIDAVSENYKIADKKLVDFIDENPNSPLISKAALLRALVYFEKKDYPKAEKLFDEAKFIAENQFQLRGDTVYAEDAHAALFWRGISLSHLGKYQESRPVFSECYRKYPEGEFADDALYVLGVNSEVNRQYEAAVGYYRAVAMKYEYSNSFIASRLREADNKIILRDPAGATVAIESAQSALKHIREQDSIGSLYEPQTYVDNPLESFFYLRGEAALLYEQYEKALSLFESYLSTFFDSPTADRAKLGAAWAMLNLENYEGALEYYDEIITTNSEDDPHAVAAAKLYRTVALKRNGDVDQAEKELSGLAVQSGNPYLGQALLELGQIYYEKGDYDSARRTLERGAREATDAIVSVRMHLLLGAVYLERQYWSKAAAEYSAAEKTALKSMEMFMPQKNWYISEARLKRGAANVQRGMQADAISSLLGFLAESPGDPRADEALFWLAEAYYRSDQLKNAIETYDKLIARYPKSPRKEEALYGLGWSHFKLKDFSKSSSVFDRMISEFPDSKFALEVLARQADGYYVIKNYRRAAETYRRAAKLAPKTQEGRYCAFQLCDALFRSGDNDGAVTSLLNYVRTYRDSPFAPYSLYLIGWIRFQQRRYDEAIDNFRFLLQAYPQSDLAPRAHYTIGDCFFNSERFEQAVEAYRTVVESYPSDPLAAEALRSIQQSLILLGREDEAMQIADQFVETNPKSPFAQDFAFKNIDMFYSGKKYRETADEAEAFIDKYPDSDRNAEALFLAGKSYGNLNEPEKAYKIFNLLREKYPDSDYAPQGVLESGLLRVDLGDIEDADSTFRALEVLYPENSAAAQAMFERAVIYYNLGDTLKSVATYREAADKFFDSEFGVQSRYRIAKHFRETGEYDSARAEFLILARNTRDRALAAEARYRIGELWMMEENFNRAAESFEKVRDEFAGVEDWYSLALLNLGECYVKLDEPEKAKETYRVIIEMRPDDEYGKTADRRLRKIR